MAAMIVLAFALPLIVAAGAYFTTRSVVRDTEAAKSRVLRLRNELNENRRKLSEAEETDQAESAIGVRISKAFERAAGDMSIIERLGRGVAVPEFQLRGLSPSLLAKIVASKKRVSYSAGDAYFTDHVHIGKSGSGATVVVIPDDGAELFLGGGPKPAV